VQEDLAKFGYRPGMKIEKFMNPFIFWLPAGTYCRSGNLFFSKSGEFKVFIIQKSFVCVEIIFFSLQKWEILRNQEKTQQNPPRPPNNHWP